MSLSMSRCLHLSSTDAPLVAKENPGSDAHNERAVGKTAAPAPNPPESPPRAGPSRKRYASTQVSYCPTVIML